MLPTPPTRPHEPGAERPVCGHVHPTPQKSRYMTIQSRPALTRNCAPLLLHLNLFVTPEIRFELNFDVAEGVHMLTSFEITNFRGIKELKLERLKPITVVAGKNSAGKTSLLEAFFLHAGMDNLSLTLTVNAIRRKLVQLRYGTRVWTALL